MEESEGDDGHLKQEVRTLYRVSLLNSFLRFSTGLDTLRGSDINVA
jgi:hypothetical protein